MYMNRRRACLCNGRKRVVESLPIGTERKLIQNQLALSLSRLSLSFLFSHKNYFLIRIANKSVLYMTLLFLKEF